MNDNPFVKAVKGRVKGRMSITGPSGSGKTWTALLMATKLVELEGGRIALLDTEGQSSLRYASDFDFDVIQLDGDYSPQRYINMIQAAGEHGYTVLIIDSLTHAWNRKGGVLEIADKKKKGNNKWSGWAEARPVQNELSDAIVNTPVHLICTMREKTEWVVETTNGKAKPVKVGTKAIQDNDMIYEFDIAFKLDYLHKLTIDKSRCKPLNDQGDEFTDAEWVIEIVYAWLTDGEQPVLRWAKKMAVKEIFVGFREKGLTDNEIMGFAGVNKWNNYTQWGMYESQDDAIEHINTTWDAELNIDEVHTHDELDEFPPDPLGAFDGSTKDPDDAPESHNAVFHWKRYFVGDSGKKKYLELATEKPGTDVPPTIVRAYGRSTTFKKMIGDTLYDDNGLGRYDISEKSTPWTKLKAPLDLVWDETENYNTVIEANIPFWATPKTGAEPV